MIRSLGAGVKDITGIWSRSKSNAILDDLDESIIDIISGNSDATAKLMSIVNVDNQHQYSTILLLFEKLRYNLNFSLFNIQYLFIAD